MAPRFEVDPTFPKPLPNGWYQGQTIGLWVDAQDHVWIVHRPDVLDAAEGAASQTPPTGECCKVADPILEFDQAGNLLRHWGGKDGPGYQWPDSNHGLNIDNKGNIWIGGNGAMDGHVLKFTLDGKFVMQVGKKGVTRNSLAEDHFFQVAKTFFYQPTDEVFVADGYGNRRVAVIDAQTGQDEAVLGRLRQAAGRQGRTGAGPVRPDRHLPALPRPGALRRRLERRAGLCVRPHQQPSPDLQGGRHVRERGLHGARLAGRRRGVGHGVLARRAAAVPLRRRRPQPEAADLRSRSRWRS